MADNAVQVVIGANTEGARRGAKEASEAVDSILDKLKDFKHEAVQTGREAKFFANELASIIPGAGGATSAMKELLAVGLSGSAIGAAAEALKLLVGAFGELKEKENAAKEQVQKYVEEADKSLEDVKTRVDALLLSWKNLTAAQTIAATDLKAAKERERDADREALKAQLALGSARVEAMEAVRMSNMKGAEAEKFIAAMTDQSAKNYHNALTELTKAKDVVIGIQEAIKKASAGEAAHDAEQEIEKFLEREAVAAVEAAAHFQQTWKAAYEQRTKDATDGLQKILAAEEKSKLDEAKILAEEMKERKKHYDEITRQTTATIEEQDRLEKAQAKRFATDFARPMEAAFSSAIKSMIHGTRDFAGAMEDLMMGLLDAIIEGLIKMAGQAIVSAIIGGAAAKVEAVSTTEGHIAEAAAGAYASQAFIPFVGPALGAAAAAEATAFLEGLTGPLLAASRGADLPAGGPFPAILHSREMVLPEELADRVRGGGMGGDGELHVHIHGAIDGDSVMRVVRSPEFQRAVRTARRLGEME